MFGTFDTEITHTYTKQVDQYLSALFAASTKKYRGGNPQQNKMKTKKYFKDVPSSKMDKILIDRMKVLVLEADKIVEGVITPWSIEKVKIGESTGLFFPINDTLTICAHTPSGNFEELDVTEEMMLGIFCAAPDDYIFWFHDTIEVYKQKGIVVTDILSNYTTKRETKYTAKTKFGEIYFDSEDVIEGVIIASEWSKENPNKFFAYIVDGLELTF